MSFERILKGKSGDLSANFSCFCVVCVAKCAIPRFLMLKIASSIHRVCLLARALSSQLTKPVKGTLPVSPSTHQSLQATGFTSNQPTTLDVRANPLAAQVLDSKTIDLHDPRVTPRSVELGTRTSLSLGQDFIQSDLGTIKMHKVTQVLLSDVDPRNIPEDKEIILTAKTGKLTAVGRLEAGGKEKIDEKIFIEEEKSWKVRVTWRTYVKGLVLLPVVYFGLLWVQTAREYYSVKKVYDALDEENKALLDEIKAIPRVIRQGRQAEIDFYGQ